MLIGVVAMQHGAYYNKVNFVVLLVTSKLLAIPVSDNFKVESISLLSIRPKEATVQ